MKISYDADTMQYSAMFETLTQTRLKDCFKEEDSIVFVVMPGFMAQAIGKHGINIKKIGDAVKKNIKVIEFNPDIQIFLYNLIRVEGIDIVQNDKQIIIKCPDVRTKGLVYGRDRERLKRVTEITKKYFPIESIRVE